MPQALWAEMREYMSFTAGDESLLRDLHAPLTPSFTAVVDEFYARILAHPGASAAITGGEAQVAALKGTLIHWLHGVFSGPYDVTYYEQRARIGRRHVQISLPQQYMFTAINVVRIQLSDAIMRLAPPANMLRLQLTALHKIMDLELAVMLHTYQEDYLAAAQRHERLATFGQLVASIGHELRNPLGVMESSLYLLRGRSSPDEKVVRHLDRIQDQIRVSNRIITDLLNMARDQPADRRPTALAAVVEAAAKHTPKLTPERLTVQLDEGLPLVLVDEGQLRQVLINLFMNGLDAGGDAPKLLLEGAVSGGGVLLKVHDNGPGIAPEVKRRLFEPLFTTKARGVGLGLALCQKMTERNGGKITVGPNGPMGGATFHVWLPITGGQGT